MVPYRVTIAPAAARAIRSLDRPVQVRIVRAAEALAQDPRPAGSRKLVGENRWRIRVGDWRVAYQEEDAQLVVLVVRVGHRGDLYRGRRVAPPYERAGHGSSRLGSEGRISEPLGNRWATFAGPLPRHPS